LNDEQYQQELKVGPVTIKARGLAFAISFFVLMIFFIAFWSSLAFWFWRR
jgi:hypothetical protein